MPPFLQPRAEVEMVYGSGVFRVAIEYKPPLLVLLLEASGILGVLFWGWDKQWQFIPGFRVGGVALLVFNLVAIASRISESQVVEFDDRKVSVSRTNLGWQRTREYALEKCSGLQWRKRMGKPNDFVFKYGWRTVSFGTHLRQEQADRLLAGLQNSLPNVAKRLMGVATAVAGR
jgi:Integral membrane protein (DUF2244)